MNRDAFVAQVTTAMMSRVSEMEQYLGQSQEGLRDRVWQRAQQIAETLDRSSLGAEPKSAARAVMAGMFGYGEVPESFWGTEVGQAVARAIGYHQPAVPYVMAAAILGVSRQRVYQLCEQGRLRRVEGQHAVTAASLREVLLSPTRSAA